MGLYPVSGRLSGARLGTACVIAATVAQRLKSGELHGTPVSNFRSGICNLRPPGRGARAALAALLLFVKEQGVGVRQVDSHLRQKGNKQ